MLPLSSLRWLTLVATSTLAMAVEMPVAFEKNAGQTDARVQYLARGSGYVLFLTDADAVIKGQQSAVRMRLAGATRPLKARGVEPLPGVAHYLRAQDPSQNVTGVRQYSRVLYPSVYPGIDLMYYSRDRQLEYDFIVAPGADPGRIRVQFDGASSVRVDEGGNLVLGEGLRFSKPIAYQDRDGERVEVAAAFRLTRGGVTFDLGEYRRDLPLVIDPVLTYSTYVGGSANDSVAGIGIDSAGNVYIAGRTNSANFPTTVGAYSQTFTAPTSLFVTKLNATGTGVVYSTYIQGTNVFDLAVAPNGEAILSTDSPVAATGGAFVNGTHSAMRLNAAGSGFVHVAKLAAPATSVAAGPDNTSYWFGETSTDIQTTAGALQTVRQGTDGFIIRLNAAGTGLVYSTYLGGTGVETGRVIEVDGSGNAHVAGTTTSTNFPTTGGAYRTTGSGAFVAKVNAAGTALLFSTLLNPGGTPRSLDMGPQGDVWVGGTTTADLPASPGAYLTAPIGQSENGFLLRLNSTGSSLVFATYLGPVGSSNPVEVAVSSASEAWVAATILGRQTTNDAFQRTENGQGDVWLARFNTSGTAVQYASYHGGSAAEFPAGIAIDAGDNLYLSGLTTSNNMPTTSTAYQPQSAGMGDAFVIKVDTTNVTCTYSLAPGSQAVGSGGATGTVNVTANTGCSWVAAASQTWITITSGGSGVGSGAIGFTVQANPTGAQRTGTITAGGQTFTITQDAALCTFAINPTSINPGPAGTTGTINVTATAGCSWTAVSNAAWITLSANPVGTGNGSVQYTVAANPGPARTGTVSIAGQTFTVNQGAGSGCTFTLSANTLNLTRNGGAGTVTLTASGPTCEWMASSNTPWLQIFPLSGTGSATLFYTVFPNYSTGTRNGAVTAGGQTLSVTQTGSTGSFDERFVRQMYFTFFGRIPTDPEVNGWVSNINAGTSRAEVAHFFMNSPEFNQGGRFVAGLYVGILNRDAEYGGWLFQRNAMTSGGITPQNLVSNFINSAEFNLANPGISDPDFVRLLYRQILQREGTQAEIDFQVANMAGPQPRVTLTVNFLNSDEFRIGVGPRLTAFLLYATLLGRDASTSDINFRASQIQSGVPLLSLISDFVNSGEFLALLQ